MEPYDPAAKDVLHDFVKLLKGGTTKHDASIDADDIDIPLMIGSDDDAEGALDMKVHANQDPLSPDHLSIHLPK